MKNSAFLGKGMKFPPQIDKATGRVKVSSGVENIKEAVYIILMTQKSERWLRPDFGSHILDFTFMDTSNTMLNLMSREMVNDLLENEPRIKDVEVHVEERRGDDCLIIRIDYTIIESNTKDNIVFPFYLDTISQTPLEE